VSSIDITMTGAAGAAPTPAAAVCPSVRVAPVGAFGPVALAPAARVRGTGLPSAGTTAVRRRGWIGSGTGFGTSTGRHSAVPTGFALIAERLTTSSTPGDLPPRDPLS
jgi:hypothetical protein